jgi:hypothetical protein
MLVQRRNEGGGFLRTWAGTIAAGLAVACLTFCATAGAARIELRPGAAAGTNQLVYTAGPGEVNSPGLQSQQGWFYLQDSMGPLTERVPPCEPVPPAGLGVTSRCPGGSSVTGALVDLGDQDDFGDVDQNTLLFIPITVLGGPGRDRISMHSTAGNLLDGGPGDDVIASEGPSQTMPAGGKDTVIGGDGNDEIHTVDDQSDIVRCGAGVDVVTADASDDVADDCETIKGPFADLWVRADGKPIGVSIENAATYTNSPKVQLTVRAPDGATRVRISNDGGFESFRSIARNDREKYRFKLASSGPERLPKTVYVRFDGPGLDPNRTFTDDIVLDETPPRIRFARVVGRTAGGTRIALRARDRTSGVKSAQFALRRSRPWTRVRYRKHLTLGGTPRWVRVRDGAGNSSRWRRVGR